MKKVLVFGYLRNNLGDDLFITELLKRYPKCIFYINVIAEQYGRPFEKYNNSIIKKVEDEKFHQIEVNRYDGFIYIGGSIFMEGGKVYNLDESCYEFIKKCQELEKPFFYISCNYGPYKSREYFELSQKTFKTCTDLCFRDKYSYELFKEIPNVRYAPDVVFSYKAKQIEKQKNTIGMALIDLKIRENIKHKEQEHIELINNNINKYIEQGKRIYLFSFCEAEGDEIIAQKLYSIRKKDFEEKKINIVKYKDNVDEFIAQYTKMEYMICERFHSLILSYVLKQKFFVISYSQKIENVIKELDLCENYIKFEEITGEENISIPEFNQIDEKKLENLCNQAEKQYKELDKFLME